MSSPAAEGSVSVHRTLPTSTTAQFNPVAYPEGGLEGFMPPN